MSDSEPGIEPLIVELAVRCTQACALDHPTIMRTNNLDQTLYFCCDILCSIGIEECVSCLFEMQGGGTDMSDHDCFGVSSQTVFEDPRQFAVPVVDIFGAFLR